MTTLIVFAAIGAAIYAVVSMDASDRRYLLGKARAALSAWMQRSAARDDRAKADLGAPSAWTDDEALPTTRVDDRPQIAVGLTAPGRKGKTVPAPPDTPVLTIGASGSGKTTAVMTPAILEWPHSVVSTSVKHDILAATAGHRSRLGQVAVFDPAGALPSELAHLSRPWTPLASCVTWEGAMKTAAALMAASDGGDGGSGDHAFWSDQAQLLLAPVCHYVARMDGTMTDVNRWLAGLMAPTGFDDDDELGQRIEDLLAALDVMGEAGDRDATLAADTLRPLQGYPKNTAGSIVASANRALRAYKLGSAGEGVRPSDPDLIRPEMLLDGIGTLYIVGPPAAQRVYRPLFTALLAHVIDAGYARAASREEGRLERSLLVAADELANVAPVPELSTLVSTSRSFGITLLAAIQDISQLRAAYGDDGANSVMSNQATVLVLPGTKDIATLEWASTIAGEHLVKERTTSTSVSTSRNRGELSDASSSESTSTNENWVLRPLASKARIASMAPDQLLAIVGHHRTVLRQRRHYEVDELRRRSELPVTESRRPSSPARAPTSPRRPAPGGLAARRDA